MSRNAWFGVGLIVLSLASLYQPRLAGLFVILLVAVLAVTAARKQLV